MLGKSLIIIMLSGVLAAPAMAAQPMPPGPGRSDMNANPLAGQLGNQGNDRMVGNAGGERPLRQPAPMGMTPRPDMPPGPGGMAPRPGMAPAPMAQAPRMDSREMRHDRREHRQDRREMRHDRREMHRSPAPPQGRISAPHGGPRHHR